jgi:hypothetical protein
MGEFRTLGGRKVGCDIHTVAERRGENGDWEAVAHNLMSDRSYSIFAFLAGVRNYSDVDPIAPLRGFPDDASLDAVARYADWADDTHSASWLTVKELSKFDYERTTEDRRITVQTGPISFNCAATCEPGMGKSMTFREFLGQGYFDDLAQVINTGAERIVFWFDN